MKPVIPGLVSICIPTRNRRGFVLRSARTALQQTYPNIQVVVSDNASEDGSADALYALSDPRLSIIRQEENIGSLRNLNVVLQAAEGEFFILLSDDDMLEADAVERLVHPLLGGACGLPAAEIGLVWCPSKIVDAAGAARYTTRPGPACESSANFMYGLYTGTRGPRLASVLIRTRDAWQAGGYDASRYGAICDTGNWGTVALKYPSVVCIRQPLAIYTVHSNSDTSQGKCEEWQIWGDTMLDDHIATLESRGDSQGARRLASARGSLLADLTASLLMRRFGQPGWIQEYIAEGWRSRRFMLTPFTAKRLVRDGWKLLRG